MSGAETASSPAEAPVRRSPPARAARASGPLLVVRDLGKTYRLYRRPFDRVKEALHPFGRRYHEPFQALTGLSLEVRPGELVAVIGRNGSGKSTLLRMLAGTLLPTAGEVEVRGRRFALLELGAGLDLDRTGRENLTFGVKLLGVPPWRVDALVAEAAGFTELGHFLDRPARTYSSGMLLRLAFSLAVCVQPEVLLIDEALAVGDLGFQMKCLRRLQELRKAGAAVVLVTHDLGQVVALADRVIVLDQGRVHGCGDPRRMVDLYKRLLAGSLAETVDRPNASPDGASHGGRLHERFPRHSECQDYGTGDARVVDYGFTGPDGAPALITHDDDETTVVVSVRGVRRVEHPIIAYGIKDFAGHDVAGTNTLYAGIDLPPLEPGLTMHVRFRQRFTFRPGRYTFSCSCNELRAEGLVVHQRLFDAFVFEHVATRRFVGWADLQSRVSCEIEPASRTEEAR